MCSIEKEDRYLFLVDTCTCPTRCQTASTYIASDDDVFDMWIESNDNDVFDINSE